MRPEVRKNMRAPTLLETPGVKTVANLLHCTVHGGFIFTSNVSKPLQSMISPQFYLYWMILYIYIYIYSNNVQIWPKTGYSH